MNSRGEEKTAQEQNMFLLVGQHILFLQLKTVSEQAKKEFSPREVTKDILYPEL